MTAAPPLQRLMCARVQTEHKLSGWAGGTIAPLGMATPRGSHAQNGPPSPAAGMVQNQCECDSGWCACAFPGAGPSGDPMHRLDLHVLLFGISDLGAGQQALLQPACSLVGWPCRLSAVAVESIA